MRIEGYDNYDNKDIKTVQATPANGLPSKPSSVKRPVEKSSRIDLFEKIPFLKRIVKARSFQFLAILPNLFVFYVIIIAGLFGSPVGNKNIAIVVIWTESAAVLMIWSSCAA
jgi:hypothetical protein